MRVAQLAVPLLPVVCLVGCIDIPTVPDELSPAVVRLRDNPDSANVVGEALSGVPAGTVIENVLALEGCWGRVEESETVDESTGEKVRTRSFMIQRFDVASRTSERTVLIEFLDSRSSPFQHDAIYVSTMSDFDVFEGRALLLRGRQGEAAGITVDEKLAFDSGASFVASVNETTDYPILFTVSGNILKIVEGNFNDVPSDLVVGENEDLATMWVRIDCD